MRSMFTVLALLMSVAFSTNAFAVVGSAVVTKSSISFEGAKKTRIVTVAWTANSADGSMPAISLTGMGGGFLMKAVTDPGATAPTDNYDIAINDADGLDVTIAGLQNRDTATTEVVYPVTAAGQLPVYLPGGTYSFVLTGNSVNSATGTLKLYFVDSL